MVHGSMLLSPTTTAVPSSPSPRPSLTGDRRAGRDNILDPHPVHAEPLQLAAVLPPALARVVRHEEGALAGTPQRLNRVHCRRAYV